MKVLIIGGVAAGTKTAAKLKREDRSAEVIVLTKDKDISYAGCGLPYYVGGLIESRDELIVNTPQKYAGLTGVEVRVGKEAIALDADKKQVTVKDVDTGEKEVCSYDKLVLSVGASPAVLPVEGTEKQGVFKMRTPDDASAIRSYVEEKGVKKAVVIGAGLTSSGDSDRFCFSDPSEYHRSGNGCVCQKTSSQRRNSRDYRHKSRTCPWKRSCDRSKDFCGSSGL